MNKLITERTFRISGRPASFGHVPQVHFLHPLHHRLYLVRSVIGETVLHAAVLALRMDPRFSSDLRHPELPHHSERI